MAKNCFWVDLFPIFPQIWNQCKILRILNIWIFWMQKKNNKFLGVFEYKNGYLLELVESKFARNGLTNWKTFLTNIFENIIWHLFAGESHQVVKITVTYNVLPLPPWAKWFETGLQCKHCIRKPQIWELSRLCPETLNEIVLSWIRLQ